MRALTFFLTCSCAFAQLLRFDVASFKRVEPDPLQKVVRRETPTGVTLHQVSLGSLLSIAYGREHYEVVGPVWRDRPTNILYSVQAKIGEPHAPVEIQQMLRTLVEERLGLVFHRETRDLPVYALVVERSGPKFHASPSAGEKSTRMPALGVTSYQRFSMADLALTLDPPFTSRHVVDETGLPGIYDFTIDLSPYILNSDGSQRLDARGAIDTEGAHLLALPRQLGLRLKPAIRPLEVMVIDRVSKNPIPDANSSEQPQFEVASVKLSADDRTLSVRNLPGGRLAATAPAKLLIMNAYGLQRSQILGGPDWINIDRYEVNAKAEGDTSRAQLMLMLQDLLRDRFHLQVHRETRESPAYALVIAKERPRLLPPTKIDCPDPCGQIRISPSEAGVRMEGNRVPVSELVRALAVALGQPVLDRTGLAGVFDIRLRFIDEVPGAPPGDSIGPNLFNALQEQLGLKLEAAKGPVEFIVIDRVERPSAN